ncbi:hypothetical protein PS900_03597 [Pseudomonas fluorescens]|uniref:Uncharacterized protein n=1 Tax=Pseudomonas fluorescens TaxID=294 RepID=A0A8H2NU20_PSEFL|nr:hypothetical protein PS900_03597 [Pseudomonas fluorescens]
MQKVGMFIEAILICAFPGEMQLRSEWTHLRIGTIGPMTIFH